MNHAANNFTEPPHRDTSVTKQATYLAKKARMQAALAAKAAGDTTPKPPTRIAARTWALGGHELDACPSGGWRCRVCRVKASRWNDIAGKKCGGSAAEAWAKAALAFSNQGVHTGGGHHRMLSGELIWCLKCGAYGNGKATAFRLPCTGDPEASWADGKMIHNTTGRKVNLILLKGGRHPESRLPIPPAIPEHSWHSMETGINIRTAITSGATAAQPRPELLERIRRRDAAAKAADNDQKCKNEILKK